MARLDSMLVDFSFCCIRDGLAGDDRDLQYGRSDQQHAQPAFDRGYRYGEGSYRPSVGPDYGGPGRGQDRYSDSRAASEYGPHRDFDHAPLYSRDSTRGQSQYPHRGSEQYHQGSRGPLSRGMPAEGSARPYDDPRWSRGVDGPPSRGNRSPSYMDRPPSYSERPPSYAEPPPSYAERQRAPLAERPSRHEEPAYRPVPSVEYTPVIDETLFPSSGGQLGGRGGDLTGPADGGTPKDLEREAFNAELDRLAADLDKVGWFHLALRLCCMLSL